MKALLRLSIRQDRRRFTLLLVCFVISNVSGFTPTSSTPIRVIGTTRILSSRSSSRFSSNGPGNGYSSGSSSSSFGSDDIPDEATLRRAYDSWREYYGRRSTSRQVPLEYDATRYHHFKDNYIALKRANYRAAQKAKVDGRTPPPPMQLNEYGDCSAEEYKRLTQPSTAMSSTNTNNAPISTIATVSTPLSAPQNYTYSLTPPPTSAPWAGNSGISSGIPQSSSTSTSIYSHLYSDTRTQAYSSSDDEKTNNSNYNKMDPSSSYQQTGSDGMYSYTPPTSESASQPLSSSSFANNPPPTNTINGYVDRNGATDSSSTRWDLEDEPNGAYSSSQSINGNNGAYSYSSTAPMTDGGYSYSATSPVNNRDISANNGFSYASSSGASSSDGAPTNDRYSYSSSSSSYMPPPAYNGNYANRNANPEYSSAYDSSNTNGYSSPAPAPPPPILSKDELDAVERARKRQSQIPKGVFDEDESEDDNVDNAWAEFGMAPKPKHRREKVDYGEPILNGVINGGSVPVGTSKGNNYSGTYAGSYSGMGIGKVESTLPVPNGASSYATTTAYPKEQDRVRRAYYEWCNHYGKTFDERRLPTFQVNYLAMEAYCQQTGTQLKQLNEFADLSQEEYKRARPPKKSALPEWMLETPESKIESKEEFLTFGPRWGKEPPAGAEALLNKDSIDPITGAKRDFQGEKRIRLAYQEWCNRNGKRFEESRLPAFTRNFVAMEQYCMTQNIPVKPLNEFADLTAPEYDVALREKQAKGETIPSFGSADASMPPGMIQQQQYGYSAQAQTQYNYPVPPTQQQQQYQLQQQQEQQQQQYQQQQQRNQQQQQNIYSAQTPQEYSYPTPSPVPSGSAMVSPQFSSGLMPPVGLPPPPPQHGYGSANVPGLPTGGTIPPVNIVTASYKGMGRGQANIVTTNARLSKNAPSKTEAQFKADAEARLKAFAAAKQKRKEEGEARLKRFTDLKKQAKVLAGHKNITLEEATRQVFTNATAELEQEHAALLQKVKVTVEGNTTSTAMALTTEEEQILKALAAVKLLSKDVEGNKTLVSTESKGDKKVNLTTVATRIATNDVILDPIVDNSEKVSSTADATDIESNITIPGSVASIPEKPTAKQRAIVDLSAVLQIEKDAFSKEPKRSLNNRTNTKSTNDEPEARPRSDIRSGITAGVKASNTWNVTKTIKNSSVKIKSETLSSDKSVRKASQSYGGATSDDEERLRQAEASARKVAADTARLEREATERAEKEAEIAMRLEAEAKKKALEESKLKAQMKVIQAKVKAFEKARVKAEKEAKEKALEAQRLKDEVAARQKAAQAARKKAEEEVSRRKAEEARRIKAEAIAMHKVEEEARQLDVSSIAEDRKQTSTTGATTDVQGDSLPVTDTIESTEKGS